MANRTISTRIAIEGEAEYRNSLKNINSELKELQSELKRSEAEFQGNSDSMEALTDKADILQRMYDEQSRKVDELSSAVEKATEVHEHYQDIQDDLTNKLEDAQNQLEELRNSSEDTTEQEQELEQQIENLNAQLDENTKYLEASERKLNDWQTQLNNAETNLYNTGASLEEVKGKMDSFDQSAEEGNGVIGTLSSALGGLGDVGGMLGSILQGATAGGMMAVVNMAVEGAQKIIEYAMSFDEARSIIVEATGASGEALQELQNVMNEVYLQVDEMDVTEVGTAVGEIATRLDLTGEELARVTKLFEDYSDVTGVDVKGAVTNVSKVMSRWNVDIEDTEGLLDKLVYAGQATGISVDSLASSLSTNAGTFHELGFSLDESIALLSNFEKKGYNASSILMGMRTAVKNFTDEGIDAKEGLQGLIDSVANATTEQEALSIAYDYFNTRSAVEFKDAITSGALDLDTMVEALQNSSGVMAETEETADTFAENIGTWFKQVGGTIVGFLTGNWEAMESSMEAMNTSVDDMKTKASEYEEASRVYSENAVASFATAEEQLMALVGQYQAVSQQAYESIDSQIKLFEKMDVTADRSVSDLIGALDSQIDYMNEYSENIRKAMELGVDEGLIRKLSDGSQESAKILKAIVEDGGKNVGELNEKLAKVEEGKVKFGDTIGAMQTDLEDKAEQMTDDIIKMVDEFNQSADANKNGRATVDGLIAGLESKRKEVQAKGRSLAEAFNKSFAKYQDINSPSKVWKGFGGYIVEGLIQGVEAQEDEAIKTFEELARVTNEGFTAMQDKISLEDMTAPSIENISNYDNGISDNRSIVMNISVASASEEDMRGVYDYISRNFASRVGGRL